MPDSVNLYTYRPQFIVMYSVSWCPDCKRARTILSAEKVAFLDVDIEEDHQAMQFVQEVNHGNRSVPTIIFPDGSLLVEPSNEMLLRKIKQPQQN